MSENVFFLKEDTSKPYDLAMSDTINRSLRFKTTGEAMYDIIGNMTGDKKIRRQHIMNYLRPKAIMEGWFPQLTRFAFLQNEDWTVKCEKCNKKVFTIRVNNATGTSNVTMYPTAEHAQHVFNFVCDRMDRHVEDMDVRGCYLVYFDTKENMTNFTKLFKTAPVALKLGVKMGTIVNEFSVMIRCVPKEELLFYWLRQQRGFTRVYSILKAVSVPERNRLIDRASHLESLNSKDRDELFYAKMYATNVQEMLDAFHDRHKE